MKKIIFLILVFAGCSKSLPNRWNYVGIISSVQDVQGGGWGSPPYTRVCAGGRIFTVYHTDSDSFVIGDSLWSGMGNDGCGTDLPYLKAGQNICRE